MILFNNFLYINPGYYQFLPNMVCADTRENGNEIKWKNNFTNSYWCNYPDNTHIDTWLFNTNTKDKLKSIKELYISYDYYEKETQKSPLINLATSNENYPLISLKYKDKTMYIEVTDKNNHASIIGELNNVDIFKATLINVKLHIYYSELDLSTHIEVKLNNDKNFTLDVKTGIYLLYKPEKFFYIDNISICGATTCGRNISNIIISENNLDDKYCVEFPIKVMTDTNWTKKSDGTYVTGNNDDVIKYQVDMTELKKKIDWYDNTSIDAVMLGSEVAYSYGNNDITYSVNDTQYDEQHLANQKYYGNNSKILVKNPNNNVEWNEDNFSKAIFTITNKIKNS